jgi:hypothetical protein
MTRSRRRRNRGRRTDLAHAPFQRHAVERGERQAGEQLDAVSSWQMNSTL